MLFEPTYVIPDLRNGLGNGVVNANADVTVSWRVNGQPYLAAFQIDIYENNAASTLHMSTGKLTDNCPFYATDQNGEPQFFSYTIPTDDAGLVNGKEYKLVITQWWNATDSIAQTSASAFITRALPTVGITGITSGTTVLNVAQYTFNGTYSQAQSDTLNWVRWRIGQYDADGNLSIIYDTNELYGVSLLKCQYSGFFTDTNYAVRLTVQTENGVEADTGWLDFSVWYETQGYPGQFIASPVCGGARLDWQNVSYIPGQSTGAYTAIGGILTLPHGAPRRSTILWSKVNGQGMSFAPPWTFIYRGRVAANAENDNLFTIYTAGGSDITLSLNRIYDTGGNSYADLTLTGPWGVKTVLGAFQYQTWITAIITPTQYYLRLTYTATGLRPSTTLYPGGFVVPSANEAVVRQETFALSYTQQNIAGVEVQGISSVDYIEVRMGEPTAEIIAQAYNASTYAPEWTNSDYMLANFTSGIDAGGLTSVGRRNVVGYDIYRRNGENGTLQKIYTASLTSGVVVYDYGVKNGQNPYTWYLFPIGQNDETYSYAISPVPTDEMTVCFWDWVLLDCSATTQRNVFTVNALYRFGKNLESSTIANNNAPSIRPNLTQYPTVQKSSVNYKSGSLTSFIGVVNPGGQYTDTIATRDALLALAAKPNSVLFLKNRKGDLWRVAISGAVSFTTLDGTVEQAQSMTIPWVETGSAEGVSLIAAAEL